MAATVGSLSVEIDNAKTYLERSRRGDDQGATA
jgi:hypothetical protein